MELFTIKAILLKLSDYLLMRINTNKTVIPFIMTTKQKLERVKINLSLEKEFYDFLLEQAELDYMRVATWTKRFLKKNLLDKNKEFKSVSQNEQAK